ncbi:MAG: glycoside hydrolase family 2 TIM barrel-domain containing protein [Chitinophagaceae bacterium]
MKNIIVLLFSLFVGQFVAGQSTQIKYLSGTGNNDTRTWDFFCTGGRKSGFWTTIQVPSCWEQQGFGSYNYGRDYKTYGKNFCFADEKGLYRYAFDVPSNWKGCTIKIVFEASMTDTDVRINGKSVGATHRGAFYQFEYDITSFLNFNKKNVLEVDVAKMSSDASVNNAERLADYWIFGGIFRPVYLKALPTAHIQHVSVNAGFKGDFSTRLALQTHGKRGVVKVDVTDLSGKLLGTLQKGFNSNDTSIELKNNFPNIKTWTSETPQLYKARYSLLLDNKQVHSVEERFGFRTIEIKKGDGIYINGVKVKMKGVNRHCFWPESGRTLNDSLQLSDVLLIKGMNMNAVRCSHYPPDRRFLDICDSVGLYVLDELAGWQKWYSTQAGTPLVKEMVQRDENHPCIIFWDNGNEGGTNKALDPLFTQWDYSQRPVIHPHHRPGNSMNGIDCDHYEDYYSTLNKFKNDTLIYMPTEFLHAQDDGGAASGMADMWELHWHARNSGGGFVWALLDEGIMRTDRSNQIDNDGLNANDGIVGPYREKEASYDALRSIFCPIQLRPVTDIFNGQMRIENRYHYTNANRCTLRWRLLRYANPFSVEDSSVVGAKGELVLPSLLPLDSLEYTPTLPSDWRSYDAISWVIMSPDNKVLDELIWKLQSNKTIIDRDFKIAASSVLKTETNDSTIVVKGGEVVLFFDKKTGLLLNVENTSGNKFSFGNGPIPTTGNYSLNNYTLDSTDKTIVLRFNYNGTLKSAVWTMAANGLARLDYEYALTGDYLFGGISFSYPENYILEKIWLGKGPYRLWKNRQEGTPVNVWHNMYNDTKTSCPPLIYPEFKGYFGDIVWMEFNTAEGKFYAASLTESMNVRLFDFYGLSGAKPYPPLPPGDISFVNFIPPMGSKFALNINASTKKLGPQSELNHIDGTFKNGLVFYFGIPPVSNTKKKDSKPKVENVPY